MGKTLLLAWARKEKTIKEEINMKQFYPEVHKKLGFGCMRLPMSNEEVDTAQMKKMVDMFLERGFNYFDTAHGYVGGKSETALKECLTSRYPRERYILTDKLSTHHFNKEEEIRPLFESQLEACGVDYFDFYLMHAQDENIFAKFERCNAYKVAYGFKAEGKIRHFGISFHDRAEVLEKILKAHPEIEVVQIQFNYVDYEDPSVESRKVYEVCEKYGKPVIVMEPIKGGSLLNLPDEAQKLYDELGGVVVVVSEGLRNEKGESIVPPIFKTDRAVYYGDVSAYLAELVIKKLGIKARSEKPGLCGRTSMLLQSKVDREEAVLVGREAVKAAVAGHTGVMVGIRRKGGEEYGIETPLIPIEEVMLNERVMPEDYINERGNDITESFARWCKPLIDGDLPEMISFKEEAGQVLRSRI